MSEQLANKLGIPGVIAIAAAAILAYSLWGASILSAERQAASQGVPTEQLARN